jgi:hypothetical protein
MTSAQRCESLYGMESGTNASPRDGIFDSVRCFANVLMLPYPNDLPASSSECLVVAAIPRCVLSQLQPPPLGIRLRSGRMRRAGMPEAPINEDGDLRRPKDDIRPASKASDRRNMLSEPKSSPVQLGAEGHLGFCVDGSVGNHHGA